MRTYDIIVIGGGPAGCFFSRLCPDNYQVLLIDQKNDEKNSFQKPCGGLLSPDAQKILSQYGLSLPSSVCTDPQIFAVHTQDLDQGCEQLYQRFYINMDRSKFDFWCLSLVPETVDIIQGRVNHCEYHDGFYQITYQSKEGKETVQAREIVGADGAHSLVRKTFFPDHPMKTLVAIQEHMEDNNASPFYSAIFDKETTPYCGWTISKDGQLIYGAAFPFAGALDQFKRQKQRLAQTGVHMGKVNKRESCLLNYPRKLGDIELGKEGVFLIGEAAGWISPSSFEGISWAFSSAIACAKSMTKNHLNHDLYALHSRKLYRKLWMKIQKARILYHPGLREIIMDSSLKAIGKPDTVQLIEKENYR